MRAYNKRNKPKHTTKGKYKLGNYGYKYSKRLGITESFRYNTFFSTYRRYRVYTICKYDPDYNFGGRV